MRLKYANKYNYAMSTDVAARFFAPIVPRTQHRCPMSNSTTLWGCASVVFHDFIITLVHVNVTYGVRWLSTPTVIWIIYRPSRPLRRWYVRDRKFHLQPRRVVAVAKYRCRRSIKSDRTLPPKRTLLIEIEKLSLALQEPTLLMRKLDLQIPT